MEMVVFESQPHSPSGQELSRFHCSVATMGPGHCFCSVSSANLLLVRLLSFDYLLGLLLLILLTLIFLKNNLVLLKAGLQKCTASGIECAP